MKTRKMRLLSFVLAVAMMLAVMPVSAFAADNVTSGPCGDNATWALTEDNNGDYTLTISGTGAMTDYSAKGDAPWFWANKQIRRIVIEDGVTTIGAHTFQACDRFHTIAIPASVTSIGNAAFQSCTSLETIDLSNANNLESIGENAFHYCYNLAEISIPDSVKAIGTNAFFDCHALKNVTISTSSKMETIGTAAFAYCSMLKSITIPAGVKEIAEKTFIADINLETITFAPNSQLTTVGSNVFNTCYAKIYCEPALAGVLNGKTGDATIVSQVTVKINYDGIGGEDTEITVDYPSPVKKPATPSAEGYTFLGWYDENDNEFDFSKPVTQNITVTAKWAKDHQLTVTGGTFTVKDETVETKTEGDKLIANVPEGAEVTVTFNKDAYADSNLTFDGWKIEGLADAEKYTGETFTFTMPETGVTIEAQTKAKAAAPAEDDSLDAAAVVTGVVLGTGTAILAYHIGTEVYAEQVLGKGVAIPRTREEVALKAWELAGKPAVELNGEPLSEAAQAEKWAVESGLMQNVDGSFNGSKKMSKLKALRTLDAAKKLG